MVKTRVIKAPRGHLTSVQLQECVDVFKNGGVVVFPTDTVYGIGCMAFHQAGVKRIYDLKGRHYTKALPLLLSAADQLKLVTKNVLPKAQRLIDAFWPGALTLVFKTGPLVVAAARGKESVAVRVPNHGLVRQLLDVLHVPLATTSANLSGKPAVKTATQAKKIFEGRVDMIIDGGKCPGGTESSVVDVTHFPFLVLREGAIPKQKLMREVGLV